MPDTTDITDLENASASPMGGPDSGGILGLSEDEKAQYGEHGAVATDFLNVQIDEANMYVSPLPITNAAEDRDGEVTDPDGLMDAAYRKSPVVFFNHSHKFAPMLPAIGTAETPDRKYDLHRTDKGWSSGCRFAQSHKLGSQCFAMVAEGLLRARSIGALNHDLAPYKPEAPGKTFHEGRIVPVRTKSIIHTLYELVEWSWVFIPSNRDMVIEAKGLLSRDRIAGESLDPGIRMVLKSLDLSEPTSSARHSKGLFVKGYDRAFGTRENDMSNLVAVRFSPEHYSIKSAMAELAKHDFLTETELKTEKADGGVWLRSCQVDHKGAVDVKTDKRLPGLQLLFAKGNLYDKKPETEGEPTPDEERAAVEEIIDQAGAVTVREGSEGEAPTEAAPAEGATEEKAAAAPEEEVAVVDEEEELTGPIGSRYLRMLAKKLGEVMDLADASTGDLEPEMMEKCGELANGIREKIEEVKSFHKERYEFGDDMPEPKDEGDTEAAEEEPKEVDPKEAEMQKSLKADLFFGRRHALPSGFMKSIRDAHDGLQGVNGTSDAQRTLSLVLKGLTEPARQAPSPIGLSPKIRERQIKEELVRRALAEEAAARRSEIV